MAYRPSFVSPHHPAAGRLHLDILWWTALAETSERGIYRRATCARSSRLPSLPQASRSYGLPPPQMPRLAHSRCPQRRVSPPPYTKSPHHRQKQTFLSRFRQGRSVENLKRDIPSFLARCRADVNRQVEETEQCVRYFLRFFAHPPELLVFPPLSALPPPKTA
jgi:hypothetical protein